MKILVLKNLRQYYGKLLKVDITAGMHNFSQYPLASYQHASYVAILELYGSERFLVTIYCLKIVSL